MQPPTISPSQFDEHRARTGSVVAVGFALGVVMFVYGLVATVLGLLSVGGGVVDVVQSVFMAVGALLVSLMALITVWFSRQEEPRPLPRRAMLAIGLLAPVLSTGVLVAGHWWRAGDVAGPVQFVEWALVGQAALGLQLYVGSLEPAGRRRRLLAVEAVVVFAFVCAFLLVDRGAFDPTSLGSVLAASGGAVGMFLAFGGPLYRLGNHLVCRPTYHHVS